MSKILKKTLLFIVLIFCTSFLTPNRISSLIVFNNRIINLEEYTSSTPIIIKNSSDFLIFSSKGTGLPDDPYIIEGLEIIYTSHYFDILYGIYIVNVSSCFILRNCLIKGFLINIFILDCFLCSAVVENCIIRYSDWEGILIRNSNNIKIANCSIKTATTGISYVQSNNSEILKNHISGTSSANIALLKCKNILVQENELKDGYTGIELSYSTQDCYIEYNTLKSNFNYGCIIEQESKNNTLHHNNFINNNPSGTSQAFDSGSNNLFYDPDLKRGNFWSNYISGTYFIDGSAGSVDLYPLKNQATMGVSYEFPTLGLVLLIFLFFSIKRKVSKK